MKSIIEEASSIAKAIENGWLKAGKPQEFSIKVFEEPEKNFFGLTKRSAKIGIFYNDTQIKQEQSKQKFTTSPSKNTTITTKASIKQKKCDPNLKSTEDKVPEKNLNKQPIEKPFSDKSYYADQVIWTPEMISNISNWLKEILEILQNPTHFSITAERFHLKIYFDQPFFEDKAREKHFFAGLSILIFQILKMTYRRPLKGFKILFFSGSSEISAI